MEKLTKEQLKVVKKGVFIRSLNVGFFAGIIWGTVFLFFNIFNMIQIDPLIIIESFNDDIDWLHRWYGKFMVILLLGLLSIIVAIVYYSTLKKLNTWLAGALFGTFLWSIVFIIIPLINKQMTYFSDYETHTHIATFCLFLLYGVFIGYSISFDYDNMKQECVK